MHKYPFGAIRSIVRRDPGAPCFAPGCRVDMHSRQIGDELEVWLACPKHGTVLSLSPRLIVPPPAPQPATAPDWYRHHIEGESHG